MFLLRLHPPEVRVVVRRLVFAQAPHFLFYRSLVSLLERGRRGVRRGRRRRGEGEREEVRGEEGEKERGRRK